MTPKQLGERMLSIVPENAYPMALLTITTDGVRLDLIVPQVYQKMLQDPAERKKITDFVEEQLAILGKHPEDWNGRVHLR